MNIDTSTVYQPYTTDVTPHGLKVARNALRLKLWGDNAFAHQWLCHPARACHDGCDGHNPNETPDYMARLALYNSEIE